MVNNMEDFKFIPAPLSTPPNFLIYRIYYDSEIVYVGRTKQKLQNRLRAHFFKTTMVRSIDIFRVSRVEYAALESESDMNLYELYYILLLKPILNKDDKAKDKLSIVLPPLSFTFFDPPIFNKWKEEIRKRDREYKERKKEKEENRIKARELKQKFRDGKISEEEFETEYERIISLIRIAKAWD